MVKYTKAYIDKLIHQAIYCKWSVRCPRLSAEELIAMKSSSENKHVQSNSDQPPNKKRKVESKQQNQLTIPPINVLPIKIITPSEPTARGRRRLDSLVGSSKATVTTCTEETGRRTEAEADIDTYRKSNEEEFQKLHHIIDLHFDENNNKNVKNQTKIVTKLITIIQSNITFRAFRINKTIKILCKWNRKRPCEKFKRGLLTLIQMLEKDNNSIIIFMLYFVIMLRKMFDLISLSELDVYSNVFRFADFVRNCVLSFDNNTGVGWLPKVWNNHFYQCCIIIQRIVFVKDKIPIHKFINWQSVPKVVDLFNRMSHDHSIQNKSLQTVDNNVGDNNGYDH